MDSSNGIRIRPKRVSGPTGPKTLSKPTRSNHSAVPSESPSPTSPLIQTPYLDPWTHFSSSTDFTSPPEEEVDQSHGQHIEILAPRPVRIFNMDFPASLENSWRTEDLKGKEKEVVWDINHALASSDAPPGRAEPIGYPVDPLGVPSVGAGRKKVVRVDKRLESWVGRNGPLPTAVWGSIMDTSAGRDKVLKSIQYTLKTYLYVLSLIARVRPLSRWFLSNSKRMGIATASLSLTRKCLLLLNPLHPLTHLLSPEPTSATTLIRHLFDLAGAAADDMYCFSLLGLVDRRRGCFAERWANRFWLLNTILGLWKLHTLTFPGLTAQLPPNRPALSDKYLDPDTALSPGVEKELSNARRTNQKLLADLAFVSYDVFRLSWAKEPVQCLSGLISGLISTGLLYDRHWDASLGKG